MATQYANGKIVTNGLILALDASDRNSYVSGSTVWNDVSGNGNSGTLTNGPTFSTDNGGAIVFDATNDYVVTTTTTFTANTDFTYEVFCKSDQYITAGSILANKGYWQAGGPGAAIGNVSNPQRVWMYITTDTGHYDIDTNVGPTYDWTYFVLRRTGNTMEGFVNGVRINTTRTIVGTITDISNKFWIGLYSSGGNPWKGNIALARVYNKSISNTEVLQNYNAQKSRFNL